MSKIDVAVWSCGRVASSRCPKKMVRAFGGTTLTDIFLKKLSKLGNNTFFSGYEDIFEEKCKASNVPFVKRTKKSAFIDEPASEIYSFLTEQPYEQFLQVNACMPFLKVQSIVDFLDKCSNSKKAAFAVIRKPNYFVKLDGTPINFSKDLTTINTKKTSPIHEFAHVFYYFNKDYFIKNGWYWDWSEVRYIEIPYGLEIFDIDTQEEFFMAETLYKGLNNFVE